jgi:hypothetical protein
MAVDGRFGSVNGGGRGDILAGLTYPPSTSAVLPSVANGTIAASP